MLPCPSLETAGADDKRTCYPQKRTMTKLCLIISLLLRAVLSIVIITQSDLLKTFIPGDTVDLKCLISGTGEDYYNWFKLTVGQAPEMIVSLYLDSKDPTFYGEFDNNTRFAAEKNGDSFVLTISTAKPSDVGMYYCAVRDYEGMIFGNGIFLIHKGAGSRNQHLTQQNVSESVQPGDSVTLNCTIHTETCAGEHSVYWFRHGSRESLPGIMYTHGDSRDQCKKRPDAGSPTQSCVYNLPKRNLSLSDAGTYYCAVALCGEILFGKGTKLEIKDNCRDPLLLVYCLSSALGLSFILIIVLGCIVYKMNKRKCLQCRGPVSQTRGPAVSSSDTGAQDADSLHYVALNLSNKKNRSRRQRSNMEEVTVYSGIRH
uniref:Novel immune-type receptor 12 n=1 Tax=Hucho hucho TaxID=62062 RepID=A0A4W5JKV1_9TELE